jgi:SAM-dependent methyltransferase
VSVTSSPIIRLRESLLREGPWRTIRNIGNWLYRLAFPVRIPIHHFDLQHGVDTSGLLHSLKLSSGQANDAHITAYYGCAPSSLRAAVTQWQQSLAGTSYSMAEYAFIDIGSGKGRAVMVASDFSFHRILGVELNPKLTTIARENLAKWNASPHPCTDLAVLHADALSVPIPDSPVLLYVFHPFDEHVMRLLLGRLFALSQTRTAPLDIVCIAPYPSELFDVVPGIILVWDGDIPLEPEDAAADAFNCTAQYTRIYRLPGTSTPK